MSVSPADFLSAVAGYTRAGNTSSADRPIRLATVDPAYAPFASPYPDGVQPCRVTFEGEGTLSGKLYAVCNGVVPAPGSRVFMLPVGTTYMVGGVLNPQTTQGFYQLPDGSFSGVEFGEGNYWDSSSGLVLDGDAEIGGDLTIGGNATGRGIIASVGSSSDSASIGTSAAVLLTLTGVTLENGRAYKLVCGGGIATSVANHWLDTRVKQTNAAGTQWGEYYRLPTIIAGQVYPAHGELFVRRLAGSDLTTDVVLTGQTASGTAVHIGASGRPRFFYIEDVGPAYKFSWATGV